jgi:hypothetical protein
MLKNFISMKPTAQFSLYSRNLEADTLLPNLSFPHKAVSATKAVKKSCI